MSERTFRAVVAMVLVGALVLAAIAIVVVARPPAPAPTPSASPTPGATATAAPTAAPTPIPLAFGDVGVSGVGDVSRGSASGPTLELRFDEAAPAAIPDGPGTFVVVLADAAGAAGTVSFTGTPRVDAPGSLGATAQLDAPGILRISIEGADPANLEPIVVRGLGIAVETSAALGPLRATAGPFAGSLVGGIASPDLPSPGTVVTAP